MTSTYFGKQGYTIFKECLEPSDLKFIRDSLTVAPYIPKSPVQPEAFPVYKEGHSKIYVPRHFGYEHFGEPDEIRISLGDDANMVFNGKLRPYQVEVVDAFFKSVKAGKGGGLLDIPCGFGKTAMGIYIACKLKKKCLVIVHKGFLLNQWIERIEEFAPNAKIGRIQGQIIDIEGKDIVIGMLQSLSMKDYPSTMFDSFGLTIVDECHHISSEVFSRSLTKIVTPYTLGLSATMDRKDGLTHVFKMFLGDIVYAMKRESEDNVLVKAITYESNDSEFEEVVYDYRGNPQYSTMITKLCDYNHRTEFILKVIEKEMNDYPKQQIMILGQNKSILKYIYDAITHRRIFTVGYYIGGMKEADLNESENKQVIVATYAMAAEGLDIKSLTTLMLVTPRTDITQAVGRILRVKRERPLVIDIVDTHDLFKRQFKKRAAFYKKSNYTILTTDSSRYMKNEWEEMKKRGKSKKKSAESDIPEAGMCLLSLDQ